MAAQKKPLLKKFNHRLWFFRVTGIMLLLTLGTIIYAGFENYRIQRWEAETNGAREYGRIVADAASEGLRDPIIEPLTNKAYLQPVRLVLQGTDDAPQLSFRGDKERLQIVSVERLRRAGNAVKYGNSLSFVSSYIPALQACSHQFVLQFTPKIPDVLQYPENTTLLVDKKLADGRILYIFQDKFCTGNSDAVIAYLKTAQSY